MEGFTSKMEDQISCAVKKTKKLSVESIITKWENMAVHRQDQDQTKLCAWVRKANVRQVSKNPTLKAVKSSLTEIGEPVQTSTSPAL